jgi:ATP-binding cassette subfamily B protein
MTLSPEQDGQARKVLSNSQVLAFVVRQWLRRPRRFALSAGLMMAVVLFDLATPWAAGGLVKAVSTAPSASHQAWSAWGLYAGIYAVVFVLRNVAFYSWIPVAAGNMEAVANEAFERVQSFSTDWHANSFAGATVRRISRAMTGLDSISDQLLLMLGPSMLVVFGLSISMVWRWPLVGLFVVAMVAAYMTFSLVLSKYWMRPANLKSAALDSEISAVLSDALTSNAAVKSFGAEAREAMRLAGTTRTWRVATQRTWLRWVTTNVALNGVMTLLQAGLTGLLIWNWAHGRADAGDVAFAITAFMMMSGYLRNFGDNIRTVQKGLDDTEAVAGYMRTAPQVDDRPGADAFRRGRGEIVFDRVTFGYRNQDAALYDRFTLAIAPGERVALVGPTGAGKSTFVKLVQRLYDLDSGQIRIDGQDIATVTQESLRRSIAVVPQDPALFHRSLAENIAYGRPDASLEEIVDAARRARAHDFIARLPSGYETLVGERGVKLSGGERQRVAIARALLADAPILIFDEATSSLDVETEREVQAAAEELMAARTTIVIAHRLSTIRGADRILVFNHGRIVEEGRHVELVAREGAYARLHAVASGG